MNATPFLPFTVEVKGGTLALALKRTPNPEVLDALRAVDADICKRTTGKTCNACRNFLLKEALYVNKDFKSPLSLVDVSGWPAAEAARIAVESCPINFGPDSVVVLLMPVLGTPKTGHYRHLGHVSLGVNVGLKKSSTMDAAVYTAGLKHWLPVMTAVFRDVASDPGLDVSMGHLEGLAAQSAVRRQAPVVGAVVSWGGKGVGSSAGLGVAVGGPREGRRPAVCQVGDRRRLPNVHPVQHQHAVGDGGGGVRGRVPRHHQGAVVHARATTARQVASAVDVLRAWTSICRFFVSELW